MNDIVAAVIVLIALVGIMLLMVPGLRRRGYAPKTTRGLAGMYAPDAVAGFPGAIMATIALVQVLDGAHVTNSAGYVAAAIICAVLACLRSGVVDVIFGVIGMLGIVSMVITLTQADECTQQPVLQSVMGIVVAGLGALMGAALMLFTGRRIKIGSFLSLFGALEVLRFIISPLGVPLLGIEGWQGVAVIVAAAVFGVLASVAPTVVIGLAAAAVGITSIGMEAMVGTACGPAADVNSLLALILCIVTHVVARGFIRPRAKKWR